MSNTSTQEKARSYAHFGCYLGFLSALVILGYTFNLFYIDSDDPFAFKLAGLVIGGLQILLCALTLKKNRAAWAFASSLNGTLTAVFLFGVPKVRDGLDVTLFVGMIPCIAFAIITSLLATGADDF